MEYSSMVDVKKHEIFPTLVHEFDIKISSYELSNMIYYIENGEIKYPINETMVSGNICNM